MVEAQKRSGAGSIPYSMGMALMVWYEPSHVRDSRVHHGFSCIPSLGSLEHRDLVITSSRSSAGCFHATFIDGLWPLVQSSGTTRNFVDRISGHYDVAQARGAGFDEHVIKPVELRTIEGILARHKPA
jgi:hypothetical protein